MNEHLKENLERPFIEIMEPIKAGEYSIKKRELYHGFCPPGYTKVRSYTKESGDRIEEHCRKLTVKGRTYAMVSGLYNESMIAQEDLRLGFDSVIDSTVSGEKNADKIKSRASHVGEVMREQERKKEEVRRRET